MSRGAALLVAGALVAGGEACAWDQETGAPRSCRSRWRWNYQVTAHRTSSTAAFAALPALRRGDRVVVDAGGVRYVYRVTQTRKTSFRSLRSLAEQRAAVPGHPGRHATRAMITLSTCLTQEDHAAGNYWSDRFDNPEHRVVKIGVLVRTVVLRR